MNNINNYIAKLDSQQTKTVQALRSFIASNYPQFREVYKWNQPVYELEGKGVVYITATKKGVNFGFNKGAHLSDPKHLLEGTGKDMRHVKIADADSIEIKYLKLLIDEAVTLI